MSQKAIKNLEINSEFGRLNFKPSSYDEQFRRVNFNESSYIFTGLKI
jgi:hypothetical protein